MRPFAVPKISVISLFLLLAATLAFAEVTLPSLVSDNMVLQRGVPLTIWGKAAPGENVKVSFVNQKATATTDTQGTWSVKLRPLAAGGPYDMTISGNNTITLKNVLIGEVWICSGQSNMAFTVNRVINSTQEIAAADHPNIRLFQVPRIAQQQPVDDINAQWQVCNPETAASFSAVAYFFGRDLQQQLKVPIGLIDTSWSGTAAEAWTPLPALQTDAAAYQAWLTASSGPASPARAANLYNGMIAPLVKYAIRGAIWYQGEANAPRAYQYRKLLPLMIASWRKAWGNDFSFYIVQLANYMARKDEPSESSWAELREAQSMTATLPHNGQAVIIDVGEAADIHPRDKQTVGYRLSLLALAKDFGRNLEYSGPAYDHMQVEGNRVRLYFTHNTDGLLARDRKSLRGFAIAGADRKFVWASARIKGNTVVVYSRHVKAPVAVRYAWADNPQCNLYNGAGLPASPFRTDQWPGLTVNKP